MNPINGVFGFLSFNMPFIVMVAFILVAVLSSIDYNIS